MVLFNFLIHKTKICTKCVNRHGSSQFIANDMTRRKKATKKRNSLKKPFKTNPGSFATDDKIYITCSHENDTRAYSSTLEKTQMTRPETL